MNDCRGELLHRVCWGLASEQERLAFDAHLDKCESCRLTFDVVGDFDQVGAADSSDTELVARMAAAARARFEKPSAVVSSRWGWRFTWPLAAAAFVLAGAAAAGGLGLVKLTADEPERGSPAPSVHSSPAPSAASPPMVRLSPEVASVEPRSVEPAPSAQMMRKPVVVAPLTASELFRSANAARRGGRVALAISRYQDLQRRHPASAEAHLSHVSLGGLLLQRGSAGGALVQFDAYLARGAGQRLAAEALYGRGRALQALGRTGEEVQNWKRLLGQYPNSAYATHAQRRLKKLH